MGGLYGLSVVFSFSILMYLNHRYYTYICALKCNCLHLFTHICKSKAKHPKITANRFQFYGLINCDCCSFLPNDNCTYFHGALC